MGSLKNGGLRGPKNKPSANFGAQKQMNGSRRNRNNSLGKSYVLPGSSCVMARNEIYGRACACNARQHAHDITQAMLQRVSAWRSTESAVKLGDWG
jgi:hypothetical protein